MNLITRGKAILGSLFIGGQMYGGVEIANKTGNPITAGQLVYISGYDATLAAPSVTLADADTTAKVAQLVVPVAIANNAKGMAYEKYEIGSLNTNAASVGDPVYLSATAGGWALSAPTGADQVVQIIGFVTVKSATVGRILFLLQPRNVTVIGTSGVAADAITSSKIPSDTVLAADIAADSARRYTVYSAGALTAGELLHISGYNEANSCFAVEKADGDNKPAQLIAAANNAGGVTSIAWDIYRLTAVNTDAGVVGDPVYLDTVTAGGWTLSAPTGADQLAQIVGRIMTKSVAAGVIVFNLTGGFEGIKGTSYLPALSVSAAKLAADAVETAKIKDKNVTFAKHADDESHSIFFIKGEMNFGASEIIDVDLGALGFKGTLIGGYCQLTQAQANGDATTVLTLSKTAGGTTPIADTITVTLANTTEGLSNWVGFTKAINPVAGGVDIAATDHIYAYTPDDVANTRSAGKMQFFLLFQKSA